MSLNQKLLQDLEDVQNGELKDQRTMDQLVVHSLAVAGSGGSYAVSWVGRIALEAFQIGSGVRNARDLSAVS